MTRIREWEDEAPKRNHHGNGSHQEFAPDFKFAAIQSIDGWECRLLEPGGAYETLLVSSGYHQACRIVNTLRGLLTDLEPGEDEIIQRIRPKGWKAPVWMNPCPRCDTVAKPTLAVMCPECQAKTTANEKCVNKNKNPTWHEILLDDAGLLGPGDIMETKRCPHCHQLLDPITEKERTQRNQHGRPDGLIIVMGAPKAKTRHCDECEHYDLAFGTYYGGKNDKHCKLGHKPRWFNPKSPVDDDWGHKRKCEDFDPKP